MVNDILEQVVEDYFRDKGYFTQHNVKYRPDEKGLKYSVHSDVDVVGIHPKKIGKDKVVVINCKSWQNGLDIQSRLKIFTENPQKKIAGKESWKPFRELADATWARALKKKIFEITGQKKFILYLAVARYKGNEAEWENFPLFKKNLSGCEIRLIDMETMLSEVYKILGTTPAHSELSRLLQLIKAGRGEIVYQNQKSKN